MHVRSVSRSIICHLNNISVASVSSVLLPCFFFVLVLSKECMLYHFSGSISLRSTINFLSIIIDPFFYTRLPLCNSDFLFHRKGVLPLIFKSYQNCSISYFHCRTHGFVNRRIETLRQCRTIWPTQEMLLCT